MARVFKRDTLYRTYLEEYSETWQDFVKFRRENGILEIQFHLDDGPWRWNEPMHGALVPMFADVSHDPETECIIITGTGDVFLNQFDPDSLARQSEQEFGQHIAYDQWWAAQTRMPHALMDIRVPIVGAVNGPAVIHPEIGFLSDVVICTPNTHLWDRHFTGVGITPSDGGNIFFRELLGMNRARAFLYLGTKIEADQLLSLGLVAEVVEADKLLERAWEIAETVFMSVTRIQRRLSREILMQPWREVYMREIRASMAMECWACEDTWPGQHPKAEGGLAPDPAKLSGITGR
jgi:enoyl-CoA hydratase/carnithine racemase